MLKFKFSKDWFKEHMGLSDWEPSFKPEDYVWVIEKGRWWSSEVRNNSHSEWVDLKALDAPEGEFFRIGCCQITLDDCINIYEDDNNTLRSKAYDDNGKFIDNNDSFII